MHLKYQIISSLFHVARAGEERQRRQARKDKEGRRGKTKKVGEERQRRQARKDKEAFLKERCKIMEEEGKRGRTQEIFAEMQKIAGKFTPRMGSLKNTNGGIIGDNDEVMNRWKEYTEKLYSVSQRMKVDEEINAAEYEKNQISR